MIIIRWCVCSGLNSLSDLQLLVVLYCQYVIEVDRISAPVSVSAPNVDKWALSVDIRFRPKAVVSHSVHFRFRGLQLVNSVVTESRSQSLSCGGQSAPDAGSH